MFTVQMLEANQCNITTPNGTTVIVQCIGPCLSLFVKNEECVYDFMGFGDVYSEYNDAKPLSADIQQALQSMDTWERCVEYDADAYVNESEAITNVVLDAINIAVQSLNASA